MRKINPTLKEKLASVVTAMGCEFVGYEFAQENRRAVFRVYIDRTGGVTVDDCTSVSRQLSAMLDVDDPIEGKYLLEVSSPGLDRPLFDLEQYRGQVGRRIKVRLHAPIEDRRNFAGVLQRVEEGQICLLLEEGQEVILPYADIEKANVVAEIRL